jgi:hypothetical protein
MGHGLSDLLFKGCDIYDNYSVRLVLSSLCTFRLSTAFLRHFIKNPFGPSRTKGIFTNAKTANPKPVTLVVKHHRHHQHQNFPVFIFFL